MDPFPGRISIQWPGNPSHWFVLFPGQFDPESESVGAVLLPGQRDPEKSVGNILTLFRVAFLYSDPEIWVIGLYSFRVSLTRNPNPLGPYSFRVSVTRRKESVTYCPFSGSHLYTVTRKSESLVCTLSGSVWLGKQLCWLFWVIFSKMTRKCSAGGGGGASLSRSGHWNGRNFNNMEGRQ